MKYRKLKTGETIQNTDEYISTFTPGIWSPVQQCSIGKKILECNTKYYRRLSRT